jgi:hypothetical protein
MSRTQFALTAVLAIGGGAIGGAVMTRLCIPRMALAQAAPESVQVVRAQRFEVVDEAGKRRGRFDSLPNGAVRLVFYDNEGKIRAGLLVATNGTPALQFWDRNSKPVSVYSDGVTLLDGDGEPRARMSVSSSGNPAITLYDEEGKVSWSAP